MTSDTPSDASTLKRRSYQLERTLGAPDDATPSDIQAEYLVGAIGNEFAYNFPTDDKVMVDLTFIALDNETIDGPTSLKSGTRPVVQEEDAFNTSSDFSRIKLAKVVPGSEAPTPLYAFTQEITLNINKNATALKALGAEGCLAVDVDPRGQPDPGKGESIGGASPVKRLLQFAQVPAGRQQPCRE